LAKRRLKVAFQGERGAYSEEAVISFFSQDVYTEPCRSLPETFRAVEEGRVDYAVVPIENSLEGSVNETYDLLLKSELKVCGEINLRIKHSLIARPEAELKDVKRVYSHPQALAQCRGYLEKLGARTVATYDTAGSVKMLSRVRSRGVAAVASARAAAIYGMKILASGIEDNPNNYTRFFVLAFKDSPPTGCDKTSIIFSTKHVPGALYRALREFASRDINLTKIESRPTREKPWEYNFYVDFEGHREDSNCRSALNALEKRAMLLRVLGSYPRAKTES